MDQRSALAGEPTQPYQGQQGSRRKAGRDAHAGGYFVDIDAEFFVSIDGDILPVPPSTSEATCGS